MYPTYQPQMNPYQFQYPYGGYFNPMVVPPSQGQVSETSSSNSSTPGIKLDTVSGRTAADIYNVNVGEEAVLIDIDNPCVYKKSRGADNKLEFQIYDLVPHIEQNSQPSSPPINLDEYVKADAIDNIVTERVKEEVERRLSEISFTPKTTRKAKMVDE